MLKPTPYSVPLELLRGIDFAQLDTLRDIITEPTGNFFYDPWVLKPEYEGTVWEDIWCSLPIDTGQARIIVLESPSCYTQHADIDDRYHLNLFGDQGYLIDFEDQELFKLTKDGIWYEMNAGKLHTAINVGEHLRIQLVVRKLLEYNTLVNPVSVSILPGGNNPRYLFDNVLSPWLNSANKDKKINNFSGNDGNVKFDIDKIHVQELKDIMPKEFNYTVAYND